MSGVPSAEDALLVRAGLIGAACGLALVAGAYTLLAHLADRIRRGHPLARQPAGVDHRA